MIARLKDAALCVALAPVVCVLALLGWGAGVDHEQDIRADRARGPL